MTSLVVSATTETFIQVYHICIQGTFPFVPRSCKIYTFVFFICFNKELVFFPELVLFLQIAFWLSWETANTLFSGSATRSKSQILQESLCFYCSNSSQLLYLWFITAPRKGDKWNVHCQISACCRSWSSHPVNHIIRRAPEDV